jgi:DNA-binding IclR family transcriptional regulator
MVVALLRAVYAAKIEDREDCMGVENGRLLTSTLKSFALVDMMAECPHASGVSELAAMTGTGRGTVHQQLSTLVAAGWVERVDGGRYRLTLRAARVLRGALGQAGVGERIQPALESLAAAISEAVSLAVLDRGQALIVQRVESGQVLRADVGVGTRMGLNASASGRVIVAFAPAVEIEALRRLNLDLPPDEVVEKVRSEGVAVSVDEFLEGVFAVAAPVFDGTGGFLGALSAAGPSTRLELDLTTREVLASAEEIGRILRGEVTGGSHLLAASRW